MTKTICLRGYLFQARPRVLWQGLFDFYRDHGGYLGNMDNMLLDYENCKEVFQRVNRGEPADFVFMFCDGGWHTSWSWREAWWFPDCLEYVKARWFDYGVEVCVRGDDVTMTLWSAKSEVDATS